MADKRTISYPTKWTGLKPSRFRKYKKWINNIKPGICGTYVSAVLIHDAFYRRYQLNVPKETLIKGLKSVIEDTFPYKGTFPWDLVHGINYVLRDDPHFKARLHFIPERKVVELLDSPDPIPVAVGTARVFGSPYKNHWLVVYAYGYNNQGKLYFKACDNHGKYTAIVPASQTIGCIWLEEKKV